LPIHWDAVSYWSYESTYRAAKIAFGEDRLYLFDYNISLYLRRGIKHWENRRTSCKYLLICISTGNKHQWCIQNISSLDKVKLTRNWKAWRDHCEDLDSDIRIILKWVYKDRSCELHKYGSGQGPVVGSCEHGNEPSGSIKFRECEWLCNCWSLKNDSAPSTYLIYFFCQSVPKDIAPSKLLNCFPCYGVLRRNL
jgi:hypothetical protein